MTNKASSRARLRIVNMALAMVAMMPEILQVSRRTYRGLVRALDQRGYGPLPYDVDVEGAPITLLDTIIVQRKSWWPGWRKLLCDYAIAAGDVEFSGGRSILDESRRDC